MHRVLFTACLVAALATTGCANRGPQLHSEFVERQQALRTVLVVPANVVFAQDTISDGAQRDTAREERIQRDLRRISESQLLNRGYKTNSEIADRLANGDKDLAFEFEQFRQRYAGLLDETRRKRTMDDTAPTVKATLGPQATAWAANTGADALLYVRYHGFERSAGKAFVDSVPGILLAAFTGFGYVAQKSGGFLEATLIDTVTGEVLWVNDSLPRNNLGFQGAPFQRGRTSPQRMLSYALRPLPKAAGYVAPTNKMPNSLAANNPTTLPAAESAEDKAEAPAD